MRHCLVRAMYLSASAVAVSIRGAITNVLLYFLHYFLLIDSLMGVIIVMLLQRTVLSTRWHTAPPLLEADV